MKRLTREQRKIAKRAARSAAFESAKKSGLSTASKYAQKMRGEREPKDDPVTRPKAVCGYCYRRPCMCRLVRHDDVFGAYAEAAQ